MLRLITIAFIATSFNVLAETSPFVGNWAGEWDNRKGQGQINELNIIKIDDDGRATALYCYERANTDGRYFQIKPGIIDSRIKGNVLSFKKKGWGDFRYTLIGDDTMRFRFTRRGKALKMTMTRQEPSACASWVNPPTFQ